MRNATKMQEAQHFSAAAMTRMQEKEIPATPQNFAIWYSYFADDVPNLARTVDLYLSNGKDFTEDVARDIFGQFFAPSTAEADSITRTGRKVGDELDRALEILNSQGIETAEYKKALASFSGQVSDVGEPLMLQKLTTDVLAATQHMQDRSAALESELHVAKDEIGQLTRDLEKTREEANTDQLTGIANRKNFDNSLRNAAMEAMESGDKLSLIMGDVDHFKKFNDTWGHQLGDQVLKLVAGTLRSCVKGQDIPARYGGEEFIVLLPNTDVKGGMSLGEIIRQAVKSKKLVKRSTGEDVGHVTMSFGVAEFEPGESLETFVNRADAALYAAKSAGRDCVLPAQQVMAA